MTNLPLTAWVSLATLAGLLIGSFLNVVILRFPYRLAWHWRQDARECLELPVDDTDVPPAGIVRQPSHCLHCQHPLAPWDNIPLISWLLLKGRCRYCKAPISCQYPLIELASAIMSAVVIFHFGATWAGALGLAFTWTLIVLAMIDLHTQFLPDKLTYPLLWLGLLASVTLPYFPTPAQAIAGAAVGYLSLWSIYWLFKLITGKEGMGYGDFKLLAVMGAWMGPLALLPIALLASLVGAVVGIGLIAVHKHESSQPMPFGPFIAGAGWLWFLTGSQLSHAYLRLLGLN